MTTQDLLNLYRSVGWHEGHSRHDDSTASDVRRILAATDVESALSIAIDMWGCDADEVGQFRAEVALLRMYAGVDEATPVEVIRQTAKTWGLSALAEKWGGDQ